MKKLLSILLATGLFVGTMSGCAQNSGEVSSVTPSSVTENKSGEGYTNSDEPLRLSEEKKTLTVFSATTDAKSLDDVEFTKWLEEKTNVKIQWDITNPTDAKQRLSLAMAGGNYSDILFQTGWNRNELLLYAKQGVVIPLNDLIEKHGTNLKKMWDAYPAYKSDITLSDGNIYCMGKAEDCYHCQVTTKMWVYQPWLDKLSLKAPTTTDEFKNMLISFRDNDPNGNGKKDEIALSGAAKGWDSSPFSFLMNAFVYYGGGQKYTIVNNGKVEAAYATDAYKNGLKYIYGLYKDNLIAHETWTQDEKQLGTLGSTQPQILGAAPGGWPGCFSVITDGKDGEWTKWNSVAPIKGPEGVRGTTFNKADRYNNAQGIITDKCKDTELAMRWMDLFYENEMGWNTLYGVEGKGWEYVDDSAVLGTDGKPAKWRVLEAGKGMGLKEDSIMWGTISPMSSLPGWHSAGAVENPATNLEAILYKNSIPYYDALPAENSIIPVGLMFDDNDSKIIAEFEATVLDSYLSEMNTRFVTGDANIDKEWDGYLKKLDEMGLKKYIAIIQKAYDQKMALK